MRMGRTNHRAGSMKFVIFGSGGMAKEVIGYVESDGHEVLAVISPEPFADPDGLWARYTVSEYRLMGRHDCLLAIADPTIKRKVVGENPGLPWATFIHSSCFISPHTRIGRGCIFAPHSLVCGDPVIGDFCFFNTNATIGHDSTLGAYSTLFPNTEICGDCQIGDGVIFGIGAYALPGVTLPSGSKVSAGAVVRESHDSPVTLFGDPRGAYRVKLQETSNG